MGYRGLLGFLLVAQGAINIVYLIGVVALSRTPALVDLDAEANLSAWWSAVLLAGLSGLASFLAWADEERRRAPLWLVAAAVFLYLSFDEIAGLHERVGLLVGGDDGNARMWVLVLGPVFLVIVAALAPLLGALTPRQRRTAFAGVSLYVIVLVAEALSISSWPSPGSPTEVMIEENAEILGSNVLLLTLTAAALDRISFERVQPTAAEGTR